jgi:hypothetical protein
VGANVLTSLGLLPLLPLLMLRMGLPGAGVQALIQSLVTAALLAWFTWRASADRPARG